MAFLRPGTRLEWLDRAAALTVLGIALLEVFGAVRTQHWNGPAPVTAAFVVAICLPLATIRPRPLPSILLSAGAFTIYNGVWGQPSSAAAVFMIILVAFGAGRYHGPRARLAMGAVLAMVVAGGAHGEYRTVADLFFVGGIALAPFAAGRVVANRQRLAEQLRAQQPLIARAAVVDERARIARELHDVVAHSVSVMVIQSVAGRRLLRRDPERAEETLVAVETTGKEALRELRRLLGVLRTEDDDGAVGVQPQPGLGDLDGLVASVAESGVRVDLEVEGEAAPLSLGVDLAAYRIVQEALTNVIRHTGADRATVRVTRERRAVTLEILDAGGASRANGHEAALGGGHGLPGMRERAALYGGTLEAGPRPEGGYGVRARLPVEPPA